MQPFRTAWFLLLGCTFIHAGEIDYDAELKRAMELYPPGDYNSPPVRSFPVNTADEKPKVLPKVDLLAPVDPSDKGVKILISEAAGFFLNGRWDLSVKRYKQVLLADPENKEAKAHLYDFVVFYALYSDESRSSEAGDKYRAMREQLAKDMPQKSAK